MADSHSREGRSQRGFKSRDGRRQGGERERRGESSWGRNDRHEGSNRRPGSQSDGRRESYGRRRDENDRKSGRPYDRDRKERFGDRGKRSEERRDDRRQRPKWDDDRRVPAKKTVVKTGRLVNAAAESLNVVGAQNTGVETGTVLLDRIANGTGNVGIRNAAELIVINNSVGQFDQVTVKSASIIV